MDHLRTGPGPLGICGAQMGNTRLEHCKSESFVKHLWLQGRSPCYSLPHVGITFPSFDSGLSEIFRSFCYSCTWLII